MNSSFSDHLDKHGNITTSPFLERGFQNWKKEKEKNAKSNYFFSLRFNSHSIYSVVKTQRETKLRADFSVGTHRGYRRMWCEWRCHRTKKRKLLFERRREQRRQAKFTHLTVTEHLRRFITHFTKRRKINCMPLWKLKASQYYSHYLFNSVMSVYQDSHYYDDKMLPFNYKTSVINV